MQQDPSAEDRLAKRLDGVLRGLPPRRAPRTLESRVLADIERHASPVWWRRSFKTWPVAARAAFITLSSGMVALTLFDGPWTAAAIVPWRDAGAALAFPVHRTLGFLTTMQDLRRLLTHLIPMTWVSYGALVLAVLYGSLFGLGAVAYRILYFKPGKGG